MNLSKHWSFKLHSSEAALPRGSFEYFERAMDCLGPVSSLHREEEHKKGKCTCIRCAGEGIQNLAVAYNSNILLNRGAPRATDVVRQVEAVRDRANELLRAILSLDDYSRAAFQRFGGNAGLDLPVYAGYFDKWGDRDPIPDDSECEWVTSLNALIRAGNATSIGFARSRGAGKGQSLDKGGNTNLFKENSRSPDCNFVVEGWYLFEKYRPGGARGTEGGSFHAFMQCVYEYATGFEAESYSGVATWIKTLAGPLRRLDELLTKRAELVIALEDLGALPSGPGDEESLRSQLKALDEEILLQERTLSKVRPGKKPQQLLKG